MLAFIIRRLLQALLVMAVMSGLVFLGLYVVGDPVSMMASPDATELERDAIRANFGLDKPLVEQYGIFMSHAVRLDFGKSFLTGQSAMGLILERMPATLGEGVSFEYFVLAETFRAEICQGFDHQAVCRVLAAHGCLTVKEGDRYTVSTRLPGIGKARCYCISPAIFELDL